MLFVGNYNSYSVQEHLCWESPLCCAWEGEPGFSPTAKKSGTSTFHLEVAAAHVETIKGCVLLPNFFTLFPPFMTCLLALEGEEG